MKVYVFECVSGSRFPLTKKQFEKIVRDAKYSYRIETETDTNIERVIFKEN